MAVNLVVDAALSTTTWLLNEKQLPVQVEWPLQSTDVAINTPPITMAQFDLSVTLGTSSFGCVSVRRRRGGGGGLEQIGADWGGWGDDEAAILLRVLQHCTVADHLLKHHSCREWSMGREGIDLLS
jgi:hypothetical protein